MDPVTAAAATSATATAGEPAAVTASTVEADATAASLAEGTEVASEAREALLGEKGLLEQQDTIQHSSLESVAARNEAAINELPQIEKNRLDGAAREAAVDADLRKTYPEDQGFRIERQCVLRDKDGNIVHDPDSGESRRLDLVVIKDGQVVKSVEVTSETADKSAQIAKEDRIREAGGNYVRDRTTGELVHFPPEVRTEIRRRP